MPCLTAINSVCTKGPKVAGHSVEVGQYTERSLVGLQVRSVLISKTGIEIDFLRAAYDYKRNEILVPHKLVDAPCRLFRIYATDIDDRYVGLSNRLLSAVQKIDTFDVTLPLGFAIKEPVIRIG